jgi:protein SDA1
MTINKKSKTRERQMTKAIKSTKQKRKEKADAAGVTPNFPALQLLHDPQSFGEKLYDGLSRHGASLSVPPIALLAASLQTLSRRIMS